MVQVPRYQGGAARPRNKRRHLLRDPTRRRPTTGPVWVEERHCEPVRLQLVEPRQRLRSRSTTRWKTMTMLGLDLTDSTTTMRL